MASNMPFNFAMEENSPIFTAASETMASNTSVTYTSESRRGQGIGESVFSPLAPVFQSRSNDLMLNSQEPRAADPAPSTPASSIDIEEMLMNLRMNGGEIPFDNVELNSRSNFFNVGENSRSMGNNGRSDPMSSNIWGEGSSSALQARPGDVEDTFDFLIKSLSAANSFVSMLTREQMSVLRAIRPGLLHEILQEVAKVRVEKRSRRALPNECAFCKNNGENEANYATHALKDWRGRVLCPVLKAFRCPRCGATGERAHTIKYCPENSDGGLERSGSFASRRRVGSSFMMNQPNGPQSSSSPSASSPSASSSSMSHSSLWNNFGIN